MKIKEITWTEERQPNDRIRYNHVIGELGELDFLIQWDESEEYISYSLSEYFVDLWLGSYYSLEEAKQGAVNWINNFVSDLIEL